MSTVSLYDRSAFFEKALLFGLQNGILDAQKIDSIRVEAPKGMVQIARYFGSEFLRPEVEKAKDRIINLVSLHLESSCAGDLRRAAEQLRDHSLLSRSKAGSDMLKALIGMPTTTHFGMNERAGFRDEHIPLLAKWSLRSLADYQAELTLRSQSAQVVDAALWLADALGMQVEALEEAAPDAHAVIRTSLLVLACKRTEMPDWIAFDKMVTALRKKHGATSANPGAFTITIPKDLPPECQEVVQAARKFVMADLPKILDTALTTRKLFYQTPSYISRYFWIEDGLSEVDHFDRATSEAWTKATGGHSDDSSLLTLFVCLAAQAPPKTLLTEKAATTLVRKIRKSGFYPELASQFIAQQAPMQHQEDCVRMWADFLHEAQATLQSDFDYELKDALALLDQHCNLS
jgi:hypothetical protein